MILGNTSTPPHSGSATPYGSAASMSRRSLSRRSKELARRFAPASTALGGRGSPRSFASSSSTSRPSCACGGSGSPRARLAAPHCRAAGGRRARRPGRTPGASQIPEFSQPGRSSASGKRVIAVKRPVALMMWSSRIEPRMVAGAGRRSTRSCSTTSRRSTARSTMVRSRCGSRSTPGRSWRRTSHVASCAADLCASLDGFTLHAAHAGGGHGPGGARGAAVLRLASANRAGAPRAAPR